METHLIKQAKSIIAKIPYITLATASKDGIPWNTPVYATYNTSYNFYWTSARKAVHSKNIRENKTVFIVIYDSTAPEGTGVGVYIQANAYEMIAENDVLNALTHFYGDKKKVQENKKEFLPDSPDRIYTAVPQKVWLSYVEEENNRQIDKRIEITLV